MRLAFLFAVLLACQLSAADKVPEPEPAHVVKATGEVDKLFAPELKKANSAAARSAVGVKILGLAGDAKEQPAVRWALFIKAREIAMTQGDALLALRAIDEQAKVFDMDISLAHTTTIERLAKVRPDKQLLDLLPAVIEAAITADDYDGASRVATIGKGIADKLRDLLAKSRMDSQLRRATALAKEFAAISDEASKGKFYAFSKLDWKKGLPFLANAGGDVGAVAKKDLTNPTEGRADLGDAWLELAEKASGPERIGMMRRAFHWHRLGVGERTGLAKVKLEGTMQKCFDEIEAVDAKSGLFWLYAGRWRLTYNNKYSHIYQIHSNGNVLLIQSCDPDGKVTAENVSGYLMLTRKGSEIIGLYQKNELIERFKITQDKLHLDRFAPPSDYPKKVQWFADGNYVSE